MRSLIVLTTVFAMASVWTGCKSSDDEDVALPEVDCAVSVPTYAEVTIFDKCNVCHSSTKTGAARVMAPPDINFDTFAGADAQSMKAVTELLEGAMPPKDSGIIVTDVEKETLYRWALCGALE